MARKSINNKQWGNLNLAANNLQDSASYIGAGPVAFDCFFIQDFYQKKEASSMQSRYNRLIEDVITLLIYLKKGGFNDLRI
jgi:hypothetical protein